MKIRIAIPFKYDDFSGTFVCNGCGNFGPRELHPIFKFPVVGKNFPHLEGCQVADDLANLPEEVGCTQGINA